MFGQKRTYCPILSQKCMLGIFSIQSAYVRNKIQALHYFSTTCIVGSFFIQNAHVRCKGATIHKWGETTRHAPFCHKNACTFLDQSAHLLQNVHHTLLWHKTMHIFAQNMLVTFFIQSTHAW